MFKQPIVLGIDSARPRETGADLERVLSIFGNNTGNLVFSEALYNVVAGAKRSNYNFHDHELEGCDAIVIAAANWLNPYSDFSGLASRLEKTKLPVVISGLGAQATLSKEVPKLKEGTLRLVQLASDRSHALSARGDFTCEVLAAHGIKNAMSTGCPSLMLCGPRVPDIRRPSRVDVSGSCLHATRHLFNLADAFQIYLYKEAMRQDVDLVLQSELADLYFALKVPRPPEIIDKTNAALTTAYGTPSVLDVKSYLERHGKVFFTLEDWSVYMKTKSFCLGTRIHGTVMSLLAGTPAMLIAHDSRTLEMAQKMNIPHVESTAIDIGKSLDVAHYLDDAKLDQFVEGYGQYYRDFMEFSPEPTPG